MNKNYSDLFEKIKNFVIRNEDITCLAIIGSQSSSETIADEFSDLDLLLVTTNCTKYFQSQEWLHEIDEMWVSFTESVPDANFWERRAVFKYGLDVDFVIIDENLLLESVDSLRIVKEICNKNVNVIIDKINATNIFRQLVTKKKKFAFPTVFEFSNLVNDFYFHYLWAYKKLLRGEFWVALRCIDSYLKAHLLRMLEWHEHALHGEEYQTLYDGRYIEKWISKGTLDRLSGVFSTYNQADMEKALRNTQELFTEKAKDFSKRQNYEFPTNGEEKIIEWVENNYTNRTL